MNLYGVRKVQNDFENGGYYNKLTFHDIKIGNNGNYTAQVGWDAVTGEYSTIV